MAKKKEHKQLTPKQKRFCQEYVIDSNGTQAAIRAGYSKKTAYSQGQRMLKNVEISNFIKTLKEKKSEELDITLTRQLERLDAIINEAEKDSDKINAIKEQNKLLALYKEHNSQKNDVPVLTKVTIETVGKEN